MNKQIMELAEQSLPNVKYWNEEIAKGDTPPKNRAITIDELENFAKLIVAECVNVAIHKDDGMVATADVAGYMAAGRTSAARMIKQHFGIEE